MLTVASHVINEDLGSHKEQRAIDDPFSTMPAVPLEYDKKTGVSFFYYHDGELCTGGPYPAALFQDSELEAI